MCAFASVGGLACSRLNKKSNGAYTEIVCVSVREKETERRREEKRWTQTQTYIRDTLRITLTSIVQCELTDIQMFVDPMYASAVACSIHFAHLMEQHIYLIK